MLLYALVPPPSRGPVWNEWRCNSGPKPLPGSPAESIRLKNNNASVAISTCHSSIIAFHYIVLCEPLMSMNIIAESTFGWCVLMRGRSCIMFMDRHWVAKAMWVCESSSGASDVVCTASGPTECSCIRSLFVIVHCTHIHVSRVLTVLWCMMSYSDVMRDGGRWVKLQHWCVCDCEFRKQRSTWFVHLCLQMYSHK